MRMWTLLVLFAVGPGSIAVVAQENAGALTEELDRSRRVVLYSPHFDAPFPRWGGLSCPAGPLHLYGFEVEEEDASPALRIRSFIFDPTRTRDYVYPAERERNEALTPVRAQVHLTERIDSSGHEGLPLETPWAAVAEETGLTTLAVPPGVYRVRLEYLGVEESEGIIRVREARSDSVHAYLMPGAICDS